MELSMQDIEKLKQITSQEKPIISLYLATDKRDSTSQQKAIIRIKDFFKEYDEELSKHYKTLEKQELEEELIDFIQTHWNLLSNGTVIFAGGDDDIFEYYSLPDKIANTFYLDNKPDITPLLAYIENYDRYLILALDKKGADVYIFQAGYLDNVKELKNEFWGLMEQKITPILHEKDATGVFARYLNALEKHLLDFKESLDFDRIIVFVPEKLKPILDEKLSQEFKNLTKATITGNYRKLPKKDFQIKIKELVQQIEDEEDKKDIEEVYTNVGNSEYKKGVAGISDVLAHLNAKAVYKLIIADGAEFEGYKDENGLLYSEQDGCPGECEKVEDMINEMILKALESKATVNFVKDNPQLQELGNIAAMVRFKLD